MKRLFIFLIFLPLFHSAAYAKILYVNGATGNDSTTYAANDNIKPWLTLTRACALAIAGDTVYVEAGTYSAPGANDQSPPAFNPRNSGTSDSNRITFIAVGTVRLTLSANTGPVYGAANRSYITWDGFITDESDHPMRTGEPNLVDISESNHITISNGRFLGSGYFTESGANRNAIWVYASNNIHIHNNIFTNFSGSDENNSDIYMYSVHDSTVEHNRHINGKGAIWVKGTSGSGVNSNITYRYNLISGMNGGAIRFGPSSNHGRIYQNVIYDSEFGLRNDSWLNGEGMNNLWYNNTVVNSSHGVRLHGNLYTSDFRNNLFVDINDSMVYSSTADNPGTYTFDFNMYYGLPSINRFWSDEGGSPQSFLYWKTTWMKDTNSQYEDPLFVDTEGHNFHLREDSPARTASSTGGPVGAYITGDEIIGPTGSLPIEPPEPIPSSGGGGGCSISTTKDIPYKFWTSIATVLILLFPAFCVFIGNRLRRREALRFKFYF